MMSVSEIARRIELKKQLIKITKQEIKELRKKLKPPEAAPRGSS